MQLKEETINKLNDDLNIDSDVLQIVPLDEALIPTSPSFPNRKKLMIIGVFLSFSLMLIWLVFDKVRLDFKIRNLHLENK